jgi:hypothetical protein
MDALSRGTARWRDGLRTAYHEALIHDVIRLKAAAQSEYVFESRNVSVMANVCRINC